VNVRRPIVALALLALLAPAFADDAPIADAKVGEWELMKTTSTLPIGTDVKFIYLWVSKVEGKKITVMIQTLREDQKTGLAAPQASVVDLDKKPDKTSEPKVSDEEIEIKGKKVRCKKTETTTDTPKGKVTVVAWTTNEVPVHGIVRQVFRDTDGKEIWRSELVDFGTEGGKEKPLK
jgi:hypothetical protein